jgi:hypothetical protein
LVFVFVLLVLFVGGGGGGEREVEGREGLHLLEELVGCVCVCVRV